MRIAIVGGGAIGLLFANYLTKANHHVTIIVRRKEQEMEIKKHGISLTGQEEQMDVEVRQSNDFIEQEFDLIVVTVKQTAIKEVVLNINRGILRANAFLFVQNGMGHLTSIRQFKNKSIYIGVVEHGAKRISDNMVHHTGIGKVNVGLLKGNEHELQVLVKQLTSEKFPVNYAQNAEKIVKEKLVINAVINPLTALYRIKNGQLLHNEHFIAVMKKLFDEAMVVLNLENRADMWEEITRICRSTASNDSSMQVDLTVGRETEIEAISGYIIREAKEKNISVPFTTFVYESIKGMSAITERG
ncbi:2-dehydropantoate 2-reductase [Lottiidibacillus patelloidae]|uniref:2-dehydropantoate 2-reductase n=1 Tax=Lottiidibacillus patelloidae TaxID=2670334 RepID=UPI0013034D0D|nr:2-dehydropantoate 2-reductase [Lottiidibacillus patelloidae]